MSSPISSSPSPTAPPSLVPKSSSSTTAGSLAGPATEAGLGNWWPDPIKFPDGLDPLITGVLARGLRFGIWVEPEAVSPDAEILAEHPDWIYRAGDRPLVTVRNQYVLDFGTPCRPGVDRGLAAPLAERPTDHLPQVGYEPIDHRRRPPE